MLVSRATLDAILAPATVAVYGASARESGRLGNQLLRNAVAGLGSGAVAAVHPSARVVDGVDAHPALPGRVDLALISVPAPAVEAALRDVASVGSKAAIILSSGFGESGSDGAAVERRLATIARDADVRLVGPNCMGVVSHLGGSSWLNASYFWDVPDTPGPISFVTQSGAFGGMYFAEIRQRRLGLARFVSVGNSADVTSTDVLEWLADDPSTKVVGMFAEAISDGRRFVDVARRLTSQKPVVILKGGKGISGARAAASHTGSLAGRHGAAQAAFRRAGVIEAPDSMAFFDAIASLAATNGAEPVGPRVAIVTISGGPGVLAADAAERVGLQLPALAATTTDRLRDILPDFAATGNPIDFTPQCGQDRFAEAFAVVAADAYIDGLIVINCGLDIVEFGMAAAAVARAGTPMTAFILDAPSVSAALADAGVALYEAPERAVTGYAARRQR